MKVTVSIPDSLFQKGEERAQRRGISRSQMYAEALANQLSKDEESELTDAMNATLDDNDDLAEWRSATTAAAGRRLAEDA